MNKSFDINMVINKLREKRRIFRDEADLKQEIFDIIHDLYDNVRVSKENPANFDTRKEIDIVVKMDNKVIPIEVKYKRREYKGMVDNIEYSLSSDKAHTDNSYHIVRDIERIEKFRDNEPLFDRGYTIFITNDLSYMKEPKETSMYTPFSVHQGNTLNGTLTWPLESAKLLDKKFNSPIVLKGTYTMNWKEYSKINDEKNGTFMYLINEINK